MRSGQVCEWPGCELAARVIVTSTLREYFMCLDHEDEEVAILLDCRVAIIDIREVDNQLPSEWMPHFKKKPTQTGKVALHVTGER